MLSGGCHACYSKEARFTAVLRNVKCGLDDVIAIIVTLWTELSMNVT